MKYGAQSGTVLIITAAIDIQGNIPEQTFLTQTAIRLNQYLDALKYAIHNYRTVSKIVFADNTGFDHNYKEIYDLAAGCKKEIEILVFRGTQEKIILQGKGYGEGEILKYVLDNSLLAKNAVSFIKLTGRLAVTNFDQIINAAANNAHNYFFLPNLFIYRKSTSVSTVFFKINTAFFKTYMIEAYKNVCDRDKIKLEHIYFAIIKQHSPRYFKYYPLLKGQSGSNGNFHNDISSAELFKRKVVFRVSSLLQKLVTG